MDQERETSTVSSIGGKQIGYNRNRCIRRKVSAESESGRRRMSRRLNVRNILVASVFLSSVMILFAQHPNQQLAEGAKVKKEAKKLLKSLAKGFVVSKLTTRKNFMPLPVPIPGKWQQILTAAFDSGLLLASNQQQKQKINPGSSKKYGSATSIGTDSKSVSRFLASKLIKAAIGGGDSSDTSKNKDKDKGSDSNEGKSFNLKRVEKQVRVTAAKYAGKIIAQQLPGKSSLLSGTGAAAASLSSPKMKFGQKLLPTFHLTDRKSDSSINQQNTVGGAANQNDLLVTAYNLIKFMQQFKELDRSKLLDLSKMSLGNLMSASNLSNSKVPPLIAMNINNKKTLMNKLNYIHKLSTLNSHRRDHLGDLATDALNY